jgi:hypothetical protein
LKKTRIAKDQSWEEPIPGAGQLSVLENPLKVPQVLTYQGYPIGVRNLSIRGCSPKKGWPIIAGVGPIETMIDTASLRGTESIYILSWKVHKTDDKAIVVAVA